MIVHPSGDDQEQAAELVRCAVDDGRIGVRDAGGLLSTTYRARTRRELDDVVGLLTRPSRDVSDRAAYLRAAVHIVLFAAAAAVLLIAALHSIDPLSAH